MSGRIPSSQTDGRSALTAGAAGALLVGLVFLPVVVTAYGIYDAVRMAHDFAWAGESRLTGVILGGGRFLYAWLAQAGFARTPFIEDLWVLRAIGVAGLALSAAALAGYATRRGWGLWGALAAALLTTVNPGTATYGFWSACFPFGYAVLAALVAGVLWEAPGWGKRLLSIMLFQAAFAIYQPAALFFFVGPFLNWFGPTGETVPPFRAIWCAMGMALGMLLHLVVTRLGLAWLPEAIAQQDRLIDGGLAASLSHVVTAVLPRLAAGWGGLLTGSWTGPFSLLSILGLVAFLVPSRGPGDRLLRLLSLIPLGMALVPALVSADHYAPYRLLAPAFAGLWLAALAGFHQCLDPRPLGGPLVKAGLALLTAAFAAYVIGVGIVQPRNQERAVLETALRELADPVPPAGVIVIRPAGTAPIDRAIHQQAEYGAYELTFGGFSESYLSLLAARAYGWTPGEIFPLNRLHALFYPPDAAKIPAFYPLIDLRMRLQGEAIALPLVDKGEPADHPHLGSGRFFAPNLYEIPGVGLIQQVGDGWFFQSGRGWQQWDSEPGERPVRVRDVSGHVRDFAPAPIPSAE